MVKANSEGQPGPQNYQRTHADGANMLADAVAPHGGIVMWRAFVYSNETPTDRFKQAYDEFKPLDGKFRKNVMVQVKNGPIDFQPREPFHPLFGAMPKTPLMMEFQITQEYLGQGTHLVYEAPLFKECLDADTYAKGKGSTVAKVIDGSWIIILLPGWQVLPISAMKETGPIIRSDRPTGMHSEDWPGITIYSSAQIADEWIKQTFTNNKSFVNDVKGIMLASRQIMVNYMTPLGLASYYGNRSSLRTGSMGKQCRTSRLEPGLLSQSR